MGQHFRHIWMNARLTLREAWRRRLLWIAVGLGLAFQALFALGFWAAYRDITRSFSSESSLFIEGSAGGFAIIGLYAVNFLVVVTTVLVAVGAVSQEVSSNTIHTVASKPLHRWEILLGKWTGLALMLTAYALVMSISVLLSVHFVTGGVYVPPNPVQGLALILLEGLVILSVTLLGSTLLNTLTNGVLVFMLYGLSFIGSWTEQIGAMLGSQTAVDIGIASSLLLPGEALWRRAAYLMQSPLTRTVAGVSPFGTSSVPSGWFVLYAAVYLLVMLALSIWAFNRQDF